MHVSMCIMVIPLSLAIEAVCVKLKRERETSTLGQLRVFHIVMRRRSTCRRRIRNVVVTVTVIAVRLKLFDVDCFTVCLVFYLSK